MMQPSVKELDGKSVVITGGTAGIGLVTARELARRGARVIVVGRDPLRGEAAVATIERAVPGAGAVFLAADLSSQQQVRALAVALGNRVERLDVLINNAGAMFGKRSLSVDGIEMTLALNHLAYFLLSHLLLDPLRRAGAARIVNVASEAHRGVRLDFDNLEGQRHYSAWRAYKCSKLANLLFTYELARRLHGTDVTVNALHPGFVATDIGVRQGLMPGWLWKGLTAFAIDPEEGAKTSLHLAAAPEVAWVSGRYFSKSRPVRPSSAALDGPAAERLWAVSEKLTGIGKS
jgi:NAD(P)-dependent dehydrogenase (short-subunit alcohol dehydrogenase family)